MLQFFRDGKLFGGDATHFYVGSYKLTGKDFTATLKVSPFIEGAESVFRTKGQDLTLELIGSITERDVRLVKDLREMPSLKFGVRSASLSERRSRSFS